jgi:hypothetical protein
MVIGEDENDERARAKVEVIADMPPEPPPVTEVRSELLVDERPRLVVGSVHSFASFGAAHVPSFLLHARGFIIASVARLLSSAARLGGAARWLGSAARRCGGLARRRGAARRGTAPQRLGGVVRRGAAARRRLGGAARRDAAARWCGAARQLGSSARRLGVWGLVLPRARARCLCRTSQQPAASCQGPTQGSRGRISPEGGVCF